MKYLIRKTSEICIVIIVWVSLTVFAAFAADFFLRLADVSLLQFPWWHPPTGTQPNPGAITAAAGVVAAYGAACTFALTYWQKERHNRLVLEQTRKQNEYDAIAKEFSELSDDFAQPDRLSRVNALINLARIGSMPDPRKSHDRAKRLSQAEILEQYPWFQSTVKQLTAALISYNDQLEVLEIREAILSLRDFALTHLYPSELPKTIVVSGGTMIGAERQMQQRFSDLHAKWHIPYWILRFPIKYYRTYIRKQWQKWQLQDPLPLMTILSNSIANANRMAGGLLSASLRNLERLGELTPVDLRHIAENIPLTGQVSSTIEILNSIVLREEFVKVSSGWASVPMEGSSREKDAIQYGNILIRTRDMLIDVLSWVRTERYNEVMARYEELTDASVPRKIVLDRCVFSGGRIHRSCFRRSSLRNAMFDFCTFSIVDFSHSLAPRSSFRSSDLSMTKLLAVDFSDACFENADLPGFSFEACNLSQASLKGAKIAGVRPSEFERMSKQLENVRWGVADFNSNVRIDGKLEFNLDLIRYLREKRPYDGMDKDLVSSEYWPRSLSPFWEVEDMGLEGRGGEAVEIPIED